MSCKVAYFAAHHCRLQPLGVVNAEVLKPEDLLGVIPGIDTYIMYLYMIVITCNELLKSQNVFAVVSIYIFSSVTLARKDEDCCPKPSVPTTIHCNDCTTTNPKHRKRSYSAILSREFSSVELGQLLYISRHVPLVPQDEGKIGNSHSHSDGVSDNLIGPLPSVTCSSSRNKSKARGLLSPMGKNKQQPITGASGRPQVDISPITGNLKTKTSRIPAKEDTVTQNIMGFTSGNTQKGGDSPISATAESIAFHPRTSPRIVSIGEARGLEKPMAGVRSKRHSSSGKGLLSQGWSAPRSMGGLLGSPIYIPTTTSMHKPENMARDIGDERRKKAEEDSRSSISGMSTTR